MVGRSNVGKSSLINAVVNRKGVARVSQTPGKTQAVHFYLVNDRFYIVDLPGYGYAKVPKSIKSTWATLVRGYLEEADALRLMFLLLDARRVPGEDERRLHGWAVAAGVDGRLLMTKSDKLSRNQLVKNKATIAAGMGVTLDDVIAVSTVTKQGIDDVRREIAARL
jgi:GTP-binding protein